MPGTVSYRPPDRDKYLVKDEIDALLVAAKKLREDSHRFLKFMANTGLRPTESVHLPIRGFYPGENRVHVQTIKQKKDEETGKAPVFFRDVDLSEDFTSDLKAWVKGRKPEDKLFGFSRITMWRMFKAAAAKAGLAKSYTLYSLRHSRAIYLLEWTKGDLDYVSRQMGHSSMDITRVYLHCLPSKREDYIKNRLGSF
jgi:integrase